MPDPTTPAPVAAPAPIQTTPAAPAPGAAAPVAAAPVTPAAAPAPAAAAPSILGGAIDAKGAAQATPAPGDKPADPPADFKITVPEGVVLDQKVLGEFTEFAKGNGLSSEAASKLVAWDVQRRDGEAKAMQQQLARQGDDWMKELQSDPEFGGDKLLATVNAARAALREFAPELVPDLERLGLGNYPPLVKAWARIGAARSEDNVRTRKDGTAPPPKTRAEVFQEFHKRNDANA